MTTNTKSTTLPKAMTNDRPADASGQPTNEELLAYTRGELAPADEARVRAFLVSEPELARALTRDFPTEDAKPGEAGHLSDDVVTRQWTALRRQLERDSAAVVVMPSPRRWQVATALAAMLALVCGALLWRAQARLSEPRAVSWSNDQDFLLPDGHRGNTAAMTLPATGDAFLITCAIVNQPNFVDYRVDLVAHDGKPGRTLWSSRDVQRRAGNDTFTILVPREFLRPGTYQLVLYGVGEGRDERLASYTVRVPSR